MAAETGAAAGGDLHSDAGGAGDGPGILVDVEVIERVAVLDGGPQRRRLDHRGHVPVLQVVAQLAGAVRGIAEHLGAGGLVVQQFGCRFGVTGVAGGELAVGDQPGVGLDRDVRLVAIPVGVAGLPPKPWRLADS